VTLIRAGAGWRNHCVRWLGPAAPVDLISTQTAAVPGRSCSRSTREPYWRISRLYLDPTLRSSGFHRGEGASRPCAYERRPPAESAAIRNAAATNERLSFGMTAFFLNRWIFAVSVSLSRATLM
jgi:hypothetical protein